MILLIGLMALSWFGLGFTGWMLFNSSLGVWRNWLAIAWAGGGIILCGSLLHILGRARMRLRGDNLQLALNWVQSTRIPLDVVECIFAGETKGAWAISPKIPYRTRSLVIRLAETARPWSSGPVVKTFATWSDGYITLHGLWCEPLDRDLILQLNDYLLKAKRKDDG